MILVKVVPLVPAINSKTQLSKDDVQNIFKSFNYYYYYSTLKAEKSTATYKSEQQHSVY